jgi:ABC transport system ATP-binding/permease protein
MSSLIIAKNLTLIQKQKVIFDDLNFEIGSHEKIGIVGNNGAGKTSLMRILSKVNNKDFDNGEVVFTNGIKINYVTQEHTFEQDLKVKDLFANIEDHVNLAYLREEFNCADDELYLSNLSGGEIKKIFLVTNLADKCDLLCLDEPTNHLDIITIEKLENHLKKYSGSLLIISHDRTFLDNLTDKMWEIWDKKIYVHNGGYGTYLENKVKRLENQETIDWKQQQYLKRELKWVNSGVKARGTKDKGRLQRYYDLQGQDKAQKFETVNMLISPASHLGSKILDLENLNVTTGDQVIIKDFSFSFQKYHKIGLLGPNGSGKTTFIKTILQKNHYTGTIKTGLNTKFLYLDQHKDQLNPDITPLDFIGEGLETIPFGSGTINSRKYLNMWLFNHEKANTKISNLSGGEKSRALLAKQLTKEANFIILDEPTNDLDLDTISILEESLIDYDGVCMIASHDRSFLNRVCNYIFVFDKTGYIRLVTGNYDTYLQEEREKEILKETMLKHSKNQQKQNSANNSNSGNIDPKKERQKKALNRQLETEINKIELELSRLQEQLNDFNIYSDAKKLATLQNKINHKEKELNENMEKWLEIQD